MGDILYQVKHSFYGLQSDHPSNGRRSDEIIADLRILLNKIGHFFD
jgi:hypothetical protein